VTYLMLLSYGHPRLPPELWRFCIRWATLPSSGRTPLDLPITGLDKLPAGFYSIDYPYPNREAIYVWEQRWLYTTKCALMLVCKAWAAIAEEYMYESLVVNMFGLDNDEELSALFQNTKQAERFRRWVQRVDAHVESHFAMGLMEELPNAKVQRVWDVSKVSPDRVDRMVVSQSKLAGSFQLHNLDISLRNFRVACPSTNHVAVHPRHLSLYLGPFSDHLPLKSPMRFPNLQYLAISVPLDLCYTEETLLTITESWTCPVLTHLCINGPTPKHPSLITNFAFRHGETLQYLELLGPSPSLPSILRVCPHLTSLAVTSHLTSLTITSHIKRPMEDQLQHSNVQTIGLAITGEDIGELISSLCDHESFPKLSLVRITSTALCWRKQSMRQDHEWFAPIAIQLLEVGIRLEDCTGADLGPVFLCDPR
jgi:hypothetical protein